MKKLLSLCGNPAIMTNLVFAICTALYQHYIAPRFVEVSAGTMYAHGENYGLGWFLLLVMFFESYAIIVRRLHQRSVFEPAQLALPSWFVVAIIVHMAISIMLLFNALSAFGIHIMGGSRLDDAEKNILGLLAIVIVIKELVVLVVLMSESPVKMKIARGWRIVADGGLILFATIGWSSIWQAMLGMTGYTGVFAHVQGPVDLLTGALVCVVWLIMFYVIYLPLRLGIVLEDVVLMKDPIKRILILASYLLAGLSAVISVM